MNVRQPLFFAMAALVLGCTPSINNEEDKEGKQTEAKDYTELPSRPAVSLESLLDEMIDYDADLCFPVPSYSAKMVSSTDARSVAPGQPYWFANTDCTRYIRLENGEKVIFEEEGPGVLTRIWTTGKNSVPMKLFIDGEETPSIIFRGGDPNTADWDIEQPLVFMHPWHDEYAGGNLYYPIPFNKSLKITAGTTSIYSWAFHFSVRKYDPGVSVESFSLYDADRLKVKAAHVAETLRNPPVYSSGLAADTTFRVKSGSSVDYMLPSGNAAVRSFEMKVGKYDASKREELLRRIIVQLFFDGVQSVDVPFADFFGCGLTAAPINSWYLTSDGKATFSSRFVMPYRDSARVRLVNTCDGVDPLIEFHAQVDTSFTWHTNTMHFHALFNSQEGLALSNDYLSNNVKEWTVADIRGKGIVKGDVLSVRCITDTWYGEGDEKIFIDSEQFPSYFGTGTEDYFNTSFAPVVKFENAFGGCLLSESNVLPFRNIWLRTRNLDGMIFNNSLRFNWELESWEPGTADYSSVVWWYGLD